MFLRSLPNPRDSLNCFCCIECINLHWCHLTLGGKDDSCCPRCGMTDAHIMHMLWECSLIGNFWTDVLGLNYRVYWIMPPQPKNMSFGSYWRYGMHYDRFFLAFPVCFRPGNSWHSIGFSLLLLVLVNTSID